MGGVVGTGLEVEVGRGVGGGEGAGASVGDGAAGGRSGNIRGNFGLCEANTRVESLIVSIDG